MFLCQVGSQHIKAATELRKDQMIGITLSKRRAEWQECYRRRTCVILESYKVCGGSAETNDWSVTYLENVLLTQGFRLKCVKHFPVTFSWFHCNVFKKTTQQNNPMNVSKNKNMTSRILYSIWPHKPYKGQQTLWEKRDIRKSQTCMENLSFEIFLSSYIFPHSLQNKGHRSITRVIHCLYLMF